MKKAVWKLVRILSGKPLRRVYYNYSPIPRLLFQEFLLLMRMIRYKKRYADDPEVLLAMLRVCAHPLDKCLQADNWEKDRGRAHYRRLCELFECLKGSSITADPSFRWALDKKREYEEAQKSLPANGQPYLCSQSGITTHQLLQLIRSRRSARAFEEKQIEPDVLKKLADVVSWSPTSCNRQPARLFITQNPEKIDRCLQQCAGATCLGHKIPCFIAVCADIRFYSMISDHKLPFIDVSLGLENMLLMAHLQGIEATILNWMHHTSKEDVRLRETLGIPEYYLIILNLILGYPKRSVPVPARKSNNLTYTWVD